MTAYDSGGRNEPGAAQLELGRATHAHYPHHSYPSPGGEPDDDLDGVALRAAAGLVGGLDDETARGHRSGISPDDWARHEANLAEILSALGLGLETPGTHDTPRRLLRAQIGRASCRERV